MAVTRFAVTELVRRWRASLSLAVLVALPVFVLTLVDGYVRGVHARFAPDVPRLVVQQQGTVGQVAGSRIPRSVGDQLLAAGVPEAVPEIHAVTGSTGRDATLIVGVDPARYLTLDHYTLTSGHGLTADAPGRTALLGRYLAGRWHAGAGDVVQIRGRDVQVVGVFETGLYLDDAAVLPLRDAQDLLGWGDDVSLFVVPASGPLVSGQLLTGGLEVRDRGDVGLIDDWDPVLRMLASTVRLLALGAVAVLVVALWRLAWLERPALGVLRLLGFGRARVAGYLATQSVVLVVGSAAAGVLGAVALGPHLARTTLGTTVRPLIDAGVLLRAGAAGLGILAVAAVVPLVVVGRFRLRDVLSRDD